MKPRSRLWRWRSSTLVVAEFGVESVSPAIMRRNVVTGGTQSQSATGAGVHHRQRPRAGAFSGDTGVQPLCVDGCGLCSRGQPVSQRTRRPACTNSERWHAGARPGPADVRDRTRSGKHHRADSTAKLAWLASSGRLWDRTQMVRIGLISADKSRKKSAFIRFSRAIRVLSFSLRQALRLRSPLGPEP